MCDTSSVVDVECYGSVLRLCVGIKAPETFPERVGVCGVVFVEFACYRPASAGAVRVLGSEDLDVDGAEVVQP